MNRPSYKELQKLASSQLVDFSILKAFEEDDKRRERFSIDWEDFYFDYSKHLINKHVMDSLFSLAKESKLTLGIESMFGGEKINVTENRAVLHTALRAPKGEKILFEGENVVPKVQNVLEQMYSFAEKVHLGELKGASGKRITNVINIGIGGSDLGPVMIYEALKQEKTFLKTSFVSNVDGFHLEQTLKELNPETTLVVIVSKTFTTQETMTNARAAREWLFEVVGDSGLEHHLAAVSTNVKAAADFGISESRVFGFWDWVGGRYSLWGAVGLSLILSYGRQVFEDLLAGAFAMDNHFRYSPLENNIPVVMAMLGIWYNNFLDARSHAVLPYMQALSRFPAYLQQADMESNGKSVNKQGEKIDYQTGPIVWGEPGTNGQHAFYQLIHQGTKLIPVDLIVSATAHSSYQEHHTKLMANCIAQGEALMKGKTENEVKTELENKSMSQAEIEALMPYKTFSGNKPSSTLVLEKLDPKNLGALVAMYEHKIFVQGWVWNVYSYDQWGVELGKQLASTVLNELNGGVQMSHDQSTSHLINKLKKA